MNKMNNRVWAAQFLEKIAKASGLPRKIFMEEIAEPTIRKTEAWLEEGRKKTPKEVEEARYRKPDEMTIEQHLFNLTFQEPDRPIKVIDHSFRQYDAAAGYWKAVPDESLEYLVTENSEKAFFTFGKDGKNKRSLATAANIDKTMKFAGKKLYHNSASNNNRHLIAFKNGTVCTKTGDISAHDPENYITSGLPHEYAPGRTECPPIMQRYINSSFGEENTEYVRAALGLILDLTAPDKFVHVIGPSGSGKGVFTRLIMKFFGPESVGSPNNFKLFANPDQVHQYLSGQRLICIDDIVGFVGEEIGRFYTAVERTAMNARCLFKPKGYTQQFDARYTVASTGQLPTKYSNSTGWARRVMPLPTKTQQEPDRTLEAGLETELADIISWALAQDKQARNAILEHPEYYNDDAKDYFKDASISSSSVWGFIEECLKPEDVDSTDTIETQTVDVGHLYICYKAYCSAVGKHPTSMDAFKHEIKRCCPINFVPASGRNGVIPRRFVYMSLLESVFEQTESGIVTCNTSKLGHDGVQHFRDWAKTNGILHPFKPEDLATVTVHPEPEALTSNNTSASTYVENQGINENRNTEAKVYQEIPNQGMMTAMTAMTANFENRNEFLSDSPPGIEGLDGDKKTKNNFENRVSRLSSLSSPESGSTPEYLTVTPSKPEWHGFEQGLIQAASFEQLQEVKEEYSEDFRVEVMNAWREDGRYQLLAEKAQALRGRSNE